MPCLQDLAWKIDLVILMSLLLLPIASFVFSMVIQFSSSLGPAAKPSRDNRILKHHISPLDISIY